MTSAIGVTSLRRRQVFETSQQIVVEDYDLVMDQRRRMPWSSVLVCWLLCADVSHAIYVQDHATLEATLRSQAASFQPASSDLGGDSRCDSLREANRSSKFLSAAEVSDR